MKHLGFASVAVVQQYLDYARRKGIDTEQLLQRAELPANLGSRRGGRISGEQYQRLLIALVETAADPVMGLNSARYFVPEFYGILGKLPSYCDTLGDAIEIIPPFERLVGDMGTSSILKHDSHWELSWQCRYPDPRVRHHMVNNVFASWLQLAHLLLNSSVHNPQAVYLQQAATSDGVASQYEAFYQCPVHFAAQSNRMILAASDLATAIAKPEHASPALSESLLESMKGKARSSLAALSLEDESFTEQVARAIKAHLQLGAVHKDLIAQEFNISMRQLQRRLSNESSSYQSLLDSARRDRAEELRQNSELSAAELAYNLGYQDERSYYRSRKRWFDPSKT